MQYSNSCHSPTFQTKKKFIIHKDHIIQNQQFFCKFIQSQLHVGFHIYEWKQKGEDVK